MQAAESRSNLIPPVLRHPALVVWAGLVPSIASLALLTYHGDLIIGELTETETLLGASVMVMQGLVLIAFSAVYWQARAGWLSRSAAVEGEDMEDSSPTRTFTPSIWSCVGLLMIQICHVVLLFYAADELVTGNVPRWMLSAGSIQVSGIGLAMPGILYALVWLSCRDAGKPVAVDVGVCVVSAISLPLTSYVVVSLASSWGGRLDGAVAVLLCCSFVTLEMILILRLMGWIRFKSKGKCGALVAAGAGIVIGLVGPLAGLALNAVIPLPGNFQSLWFYAFAIVTGIAVVMPAKACGKRFRLGILAVRAVCFPYTLYFFVVFLPFVPVGVLGLVVGLGVLLLFPLLLFIFHLGLLLEDIRAVSENLSRAVALTVVAVGVSVAPLGVIGTLYAERVVLRQALAFNSCPDYSKTLQFQGSHRLLRSVLKSGHTRSHKDRVPLIDPLRQKIVFDGMVLSAARSAALFKAFFGEGLESKPKARWTVRPPERNVVLHQIERIPAQRGDSNVRYKILLRNDGGNRSEYETKLRVPEGVLIADFALEVGEELVPGRIFERSAATAIYKQIRDVERRDPGLLRYDSPTQLDFRVYPFAIEEIRTVHIEFAPAAGRAVTVYLGERALSFGGKQTALTGAASGQSFVQLNAEVLTGLPRFEPRPYVHAFVPWNKPTSAEETARISEIMTRLETDDLRMTAVNYQAQDLEVTDDLTRTLEQCWLPVAGGSCMPHAIGRALWQRTREAGDDEQWRSYPVLFPMDGTKIERGWAEVGTLYAEPESLVNAAIALRMNGVVRVLRADATDSLLRFPGTTPGPLEVYDGKTGAFSPVASEQVTEQAYLDSLGLWLRSSQARRNPAEAEETLAQFVKRSQETGIMVPMSSYIVVENSAQWKMLERMHKQRLKGDSGLGFTTPAPPMWLLLPAVLLVNFVRDRRKRCGGYTA